MENKGKPMRAAVVFDIELDGGFDIAAAFQAELTKFAKSFEAKYKSNKTNDKSNHSNFVQITQTKAELLLSERRGPTGELNNIVFRGTRGPNVTSLSKAFLASLDLPEFEDHIHKTRIMQAITAGQKSGKTTPEINDMIKESQARWREMGAVLSR